MSPVGRRRVQLLILITLFQIPRITMAIPEYEVGFGASSPTVCCSNTSKAYVFGPDLQNDSFVCLENKSGGGEFLFSTNGVDFANSIRLIVTKDRNWVWFWIRGSVSSTTPADAYIWARRHDCGGGVCGQIPLTVDMTSPA